MVDSFRKSFFRWSHEGFLVPLVRLRSDLGKSGCIFHLLEGIQFGGDGFYGLIGLDLRIPWFMVSLFGALEESYCRITGDLRGSRRSQYTQDNRESRGAWVISWFQRIAIWAGINGKVLFWVSPLKTNQGRSDVCDTIWSEIEMGGIALCDYTDSDRWIVIFSTTEKGKFNKEKGMSLMIFSLTILNLRFIESKDFYLKEDITIWSLWCLHRGGLWCDSLWHLYITLKRYRFLYIFSLVIAERASSQLITPFLISVLIGVCPLWLLVVIMAQLALNKGKAAMVRTETVKISGALLSQRIQQFSLTLIGRLMNPSIQRMDSLVTNMPKIWKMEDRVVGADLGKGTFQFNFQSEEDLQGVLHNVPYHFDGWMVSLVRWEPIISSTYPSAINLWVKVTGIPMHLWEESTLQAIGKKVGFIRDIDVDSGSLHVTVNGFNPLVFQMVVPFDTGDEVMVSLEYEKMAKYCTHCLRLTHDVSVCPDLKRVAGRFYEDQTERRGVPRQQQVAKQAIQGQEGGWEKQGKTAKRALDFPSEEISGGFHYQMEVGGNSRQNPRRYEKNQVPLWGQKRGFPGTWAENSDNMGKGLPKVSGAEPSHHSQGVIPFGKGVGPAWPKPLYQPKKDSNVAQDLQVTSQSDMNTERDAGKSDLVMEDVPEMQDKALSDGLNLVESTDDLLEEGEFPDGEATDERATEDVVTDVEENSNPMGEIGIAKGDTIKKAAGTQAFKEKEGTKAGVANRGSKKGMVALPKPPADT